MTTIGIAPSHADMARRMLTTPRRGKLDWLWQWDTYEFRARTAKGGHDVGLISAERSAPHPGTPTFHVSHTAPALCAVAAHNRSFRPGHAYPGVGHLLDVVLVKLNVYGHYDQRLPPFHGGNTGSIPVVS